MSRPLFRAASLLTTLRIAASGNVARLARHLVRRELFKRIARALR